MAAVTHRTAVGNTTDANTIGSGSFNPAVGDLLIGLGVATGSVQDPGVLSLTPTNGVSSFTRIARAVGGPTIHSHYLFVANQLTTGTASMSTTFDVTGDIATGLYLAMASVSGMSLTGSAAVRQTAVINDGAGGVAPVFTFGAACLTGNPTIGVLGNISTSGLSVPAGWTEPVGADITWSTPTYGVHYIFRDSGFTGTTVTYPSTETAHGGVMVELDTTAPATLPPIFVQPPRRP